MDKLQTKRDNQQVIVDQEKLKKEYLKDKEDEEF